ncbi:MAG: hypothetical protein JWP81_507 [Ferruginibacter sp.]|nr:hypothetical protein [Ferruginibacter sp.]
MTLLFGMPGGVEWIFLFVAILPSLIIPILAIVLYLRNRELKKQVQILTAENNTLLARLEKG